MKERQQTRLRISPLLKQVQERVEEKGFIRVSSPKNPNNFPLGGGSPEEVASFYNEKRGIQVDFYGVPNRKGELTVLISMSYQLLEFVTSTDDPEQLRRARAILGFDLMEKPAGQKMGALSPKAMAKRIRAKIMDGR